MILKDNYQRGKWATQLFVAYAIMSFLLACVNFSSFITYRSLFRGNQDADILQKNLLLTSVVGLLYTVVAILVIIFFLMWLRRAYFNIQTAYPNRTEFTDGWAIGAWFVPFLNLVRPYEIVKEVWQKTFGLLDSDQKDETAKIGWWWATFLIANFFNSIINYVYQEPDIQVVQRMFKWMCLGNLIQIIPLGIMIKILLEMRKAESMVRAQFHSPAPEDQLYEMEPKKAFD
jgi:hypothetical protein